MFYLMNCQADARNGVMGIVIQVIFKVHPRWFYILIKAQNICINRKVKRLFHDSRITEAGIFLQKCLYQFNFLNSRWILDIIYENDLINNRNSIRFMTNTKTNLHRGNTTSTLYTGCFGRGANCFVFDFEVGLHHRLPELNRSLRFEFLNRAYDFY